MGERWMHRPRTKNFWEARSARRYGSEHAGWFPSEEKAREFAEKEIAKAGSGGRIQSVVNYCVYYDIYEEEA
jgi:hypothetical protein